MLGANSVSQQDYIAIVAALPDSRIPIVRQYRPTLESFTWELPAGLVEFGRDAAACCRRELMEETGFAARAVHALGALGSYAPCTRGCRTGCIRSTSSLTRSNTASTGASSASTSMAPNTASSCELMEETGFAARAVHALGALGSYAPCTRGCRTGCIRSTSSLTRSNTASTGASSASTSMAPNTASSCAVNPGKQLD